VTVEKLASALDITMADLLNLCEQLHHTQHN
jgi:hypothetical protein